MPTSPTSPIRAHHRLMREIIASSFSDQNLSPRPEEFDLVSLVFQRAGGSWSEVFQGSADDIGLLKKTLKVAIKGGLVTKAPEWGG